MAVVRDHLHTVPAVSLLTARCVCSKDRITRPEFTTLVHSALGGCNGGSTMSSAELDLLYRVLDTNSDGQISVQELERAHQSVTNVTDQEAEMSVRM